MEGTLQEKLFKNKESGWKSIDEEETKKVFELSKKYIDFLNIAKTERDFVKSARKLADANGYKDIIEFSTLKPGDKIYFVNRNKSMYLAIIGEEPIENGLRIIGSHIDSPRLDLKPNPLYEDTGLAYLKTHYYGGIKKYQWTTIPLSMHGVVVKPNGERIEISIGENDIDPVFTISDLLPHLAAEQMERKLKDGVQGEDLNILMGSIPYSDDTVTERVKLNVLDLLNQKYGITEVDFISSEIEFVPAFKARSLGLDYSMVGAYGQDDKVCCYTALRGLLNIETPKKTAVCVLTDKEEVGFNGVTGMYTMNFEDFVLEILDKKGESAPSSLQRTFSNSKAISADVDAGYDPNYPSAFERNNTSYIGKGITIVKYTGSRGKSGASEAPSEMVAELRRIYENAGVKYQACELGKVDKGGGGTIALTLANRGMEVVDSGVPVIGMHSPYEITSKYDVYAAYKGYEAFYRG